ncbi:hypothetical protein [Kyrpidia sp.]|uniref:hypothetical protein n=1 Tax=Kyrpidia sp. TaxID=2073077 RepID=UPI00258E7503|nr:hypothetical protein [Kyrpidia sp.]MCL6575879.1 hypothetical protein [Kyrpidia sp.]
MRGFIGRLLTYAALLLMCAGVIAIGFDIAQRGMNALAGDPPPSPPWTPVGERLNQRIETAAGDVSVAVEQVGVAAGSWMKGQTRNLLLKMFADR